MIGSVASRRWLAVFALAASGGPLAACEYDGIPGYNHATGQIDADPYAGAYTEVAEKVALDQRAAALEAARTSFIQRFGLVETADSDGGSNAGATSLALVTTVAKAADAGPN